MPATPISIHWPNGSRTTALPGCPWLQAAQAAGVIIPTGCLGGSCGACEIDVNGRTVRACIATVPSSRRGGLRVELTTDPYW
jgi:succinate dehydrogenase/fumarate reductase-like Fe-S protein